MDRVEQNSHQKKPLQAGARLCKALGPEFLPYLGVVMPPLLKTAALEPDVKVRGCVRVGCGCDVCACVCGCVCLCQRVCVCGSGCV